MKKTDKLVEKHCDVQNVYSALNLFFPQVSEKGSLTADEFAKLVGMSVLLAKER